MKAFLFDMMRLWYNNGKSLGKTFFIAKMADIGGSISTLRYYAGWADKVHGQTIEVRSDPVIT
jgi:acyl-CoA reductase-like NAD-dependent aldehyde dehydrogenase